MTVLKAAKRNKLPSSTFALPSKRAYPINDLAHGRAALSMLHNASPSEQATIKRAVKKKFPGITQGSGELTPIGQRTLAGFEKKYGTAEGHKKFEAACERGTIDRAKMMKGD